MSCSGAPTSSVRSFGSSQPIHVARRRERNVDARAVRSRRRVARGERGGEFGQHRPDVFPGRPPFPFTSLPDAGDRHRPRRLPEQRQTPGRLDRPQGAVVVRHACRSGSLGGLRCRGRAPACGPRRDRSSSPRRTGRRRPSSAARAEGQPSGGATHPPRPRSSRASSGRDPERRARSPGAGRHARSRWSWARGTMFARRAGAAAMSRK